MRRKNPYRRKSDKPLDLVAEALALFDRSVHAAIAESSGSMVIHRCSHPIEGVEGQPACELPVDGAALMRQVSDQPEGAAKQFYCCVHLYKTAYEAVGVDTNSIYEASPYFKALKSRAPA